MTIAMIPNIPTEATKILELVELIQERYRRRTAWHKAEKSLILQGKAICRRICNGEKVEGSELFDAVAKLPPDVLLAVLSDQPVDLDQQMQNAVREVHPILTARATLRYYREAVEEELTSLVKPLPITAFIEGIDGVSYLSLAMLIGSAGNISRFPTVQKLWKRMGLAVMPNGRQRQMRDAEQAKLHGYSPSRRSVSWNIGTSILRSQTEKLEDLIDEETGKPKRDPKTGKKIKSEVVKKPAGPWRIVYDKRRAYEEAKNEAGDYAEQAAKRLKEANFGVKTEAHKAYSAGKLPKLHLHARAQRFMEKRFLRELWCEWHRIMPHLEEEVAAADPSPIAIPA